MQLYALRQAKEGYVYDKDTVWQKEFEELFPYDETQDQLNAIDDTKRDMESKKIMDRLICGDVGYGKTEVAIRAAFKEARETKGMPTAIIAKTTKGKGVSFMENAVGWHGKAPNDEEYKIAMEDLEKAGEALCQK